MHHSITGGEARTLLSQVPRPKIGIFEPVPFNVKWRRPLEKGLAAIIVLVLMTSS